MLAYQKERAIARIKATYFWLSEEEVTACFDMALSDYLMARFPSANKRPKAEEFEIDYYVAEWLYKRMIDILSRAGGLNLTAYKENGVNLTYGGSYIDPQLVAMVMPKASVPR